MYQNNSVIFSCRGDRRAFFEVNMKLAKAGLNVVHDYDGGHMHYYYKHGKCDGNTAHALRLIIQGIIHLYANLGGIEREQVLVAV